MSWVEPITQLKLLTLHHSHIKEIMDVVMHIIVPIQHTTLHTGIRATISGLIALCQSWVTSGVGASMDNSAFQYCKIK
jgi:hypothetical protein